MDACSRCGAADDRHTKKCYDAMVLGIALGVERSPMYERLLKLESDNRVLRRLLHQHLVPMGRRVDDPLPEVPEVEVPAPVTQLPPDYYTSRQPKSEPVHPDRLAEIQREVDFLNAAPGLEVIRHDDLNATVRPKRDDDYTAEALDRDVEPEPAPTPAGTDWAELIRTARKRLKWSWERMGTALGVSGRTIGNWEKGTFKPAPKYHAKLRQLAAGDKPTRRKPPSPQPDRSNPEVPLAEAAAQEYIATHLVAATPDLPKRVTRQGATTRAWDEHFVTARELLDGYKTWATANGKPIVPSSDRMLGQAAGKVPALTGKRQGPVVQTSYGPSKPMCYFGVQLLDDTEPEPQPEPEPPSRAELAAQQTEAMRKLLAASSIPTVEHVEDEPVQIPHSQAEVELKLAQLKTYGIGGAAGVPRAAAQAAVDGLHPTGRDVWKWSPPESAQGISDADLDATAYQLLVKCMNGLPAEYGYDYKDDVLATNGFVQEDVDAALRNPQRVEIRPESWDREKRYPILGFTRGDVQVILGMRTPAKPRVIAAYWKALNDKTSNHTPGRVPGAGRPADSIPTRPFAAIERLRAKGAEIPDPGPDERPVSIVYKGQDLGKITTSRKTSKHRVETDYLRVLRRIEAIDTQRQEVLV